MQRWCAALPAFSATLLPKPKLITVFLPCYLFKPLWIACVWVRAQSGLTLCDAVGCSLPSSSVHETLQARILEWVAISFSGDSSPPRDWTWASYFPALTVRFFTTSITWKPHYALWSPYQYHPYITDVYRGAKRCRELTYSGLHKH